MLTVFVSGGDASQGDIGVHSCGDGSRAMLVPTATLTTKVGAIHGFSTDAGEPVEAWCAFPSVAHCFSKHGVHGDRARSTTTPCALVG